MSEEFLRPYFGDNWQSAAAVIQCESSGNPEAYNPAGPFVGLFQIYVGNWGGRYDAEMLK